MPHRAYGARTTVCRLDGHAKVSKDVGQLRRDALRNCTREAVHDHSHGLDVVGIRNVRDRQVGQEIATDLDGLGVR
jgi:hypothetical protein